MKRAYEWDKRSLATARKILEAHTDYRRALHEVSTKLGHEISHDALKRAFARHGLASPGSYVQQPPVKPLELVEQREKKDASERLRKQHDEMVMQLREANRRQAFIDAVQAGYQPPKIRPRERQSGKREMTAVALLSDLHVEERVESIMVAGRNHYDLETADRRLGRAWDSILWSVEHHRANGGVVIRDLVLAFMGDMMTGHIHEDLVESTELAPTETALWLMPRLRSGIRTLLDRGGFERIVIPCSYGNHGRIGKGKPRIATAAVTNYEWLMYSILASEFANEPRVTFEVSKSHHQYVQAYEFLLEFHHGDSFRYQGGVGGIGIPLLKYVAAEDQVRYAHYRHVGHWHQARDFGRAIVNGSLIGFGPFSRWIHAPFEEPQQVFYLLDSRRGKTMFEPLWVGEVASSEQRRAA